MTGVPNIGQTAAASAPANPHRNAMLKAIMAKPHAPTVPTGAPSIPGLKGGC